MEDWAMRGGEHLLDHIERELTLVSRHQLATTARGVLERSAYLLLSAFIFVVINLVVDILYTVVDPRLRSTINRPA